TSCGPRTSRLMVKVLLEEVQRLAIPMLTSATVIKLLHQRDENGEDRVAGAILATGHRAHNPWGLAIVTAPNVVLATGGLASFIATVFIHTNVSARWVWRWRKV
ncbi:FAD-binding protein, partial [Pseudomonas aeruginosa]|uniref:FAD-binding protein n=1 Tax=Pseudomonas aeruginosa TaxID=287 RepID=UPI0031B7347D